MNMFLIMTNSIILLLSKIVLFLTLLHFMFTTSYDHAIIVSISIISMTISEIYLNKVLLKELNENK